MHGGGETHACIMHAWKNHACIMDGMVDMCACVMRVSYTEFPAGMSLPDISLPHRDPPEPTGDEPDDFEFVAPKIYEPVRLCVLEPS